MEKKKKCEGKCPKCGSEEVVYMDGYVQDEMYVYDCFCNDCRAEFQECSSITYKETRYR